MESSELFSSTIDIILILLPFVVPVLLATLLFDMWIYYVRDKFLSNQDNIVLKIMPPADVFKTPLAMELFINGLYQLYGESDWKEKYWQGSVRPWFSLEIASNNGNVNFYIWTRREMAGFIEAQIYAQYPGIEVIEVEDYASSFEFDNSKHKLWGLEYHFTQDNSIPIKTYVDYGLDKASKDDEKTDPITPTLEFLGSMREGERAWLQIIVRAHIKEDKDPKSWFGKTDLWKDKHKEEVKKIRDTYKEKGKEGDKPLITPVSKIQEERIEAIERAQGKLPFDVGIRGLYISEKDIFNPINKGGLIGSFQQYSSANLNGFKPGFKPSTDWWNDPFEKKKKKMGMQLLEHYQERAYFFKPFMRKKRPILVMNAEELATMFHFPGSVALTPTLERVQSRKTTAPSDLPI